MTDNAFLEYVRGRLPDGPKAAHPGRRPESGAVAGEPESPGKAGGAEATTATGRSGATDPAQGFRLELEAVGGTVERVESPHAFIRRLQQLAAESGWRKLLVDGAFAPPFATDRWASSVGGAGLDVIDVSKANRTEAATADVGITRADWAVADTGSLVQIARPGRARLVSLLPPVHIALLPEDRIVPTRSELFARLRKAAMEATPGAEAAPGSPSPWPSNISFITGPSRTADIESDLSIGVHGPGRVHVFLLPPREEEN